MYGADVGVLVLDARMPRIVGDIGNASTFAFPVLYEVVHGARPVHVVEREASGLLPAFIEAGQRLVDTGVSGIVTSCGFLVLYQAELTAALPVPVLTSSLLQISYVLLGLAADRKLGVVTANGSTLTNRHFAAAGVAEPDQRRVVIVGLEDTVAFYPTIVLGTSAVLAADELEREVVERCASALEVDDSIAGWVFECTNLLPYADAVRTATELPVWDVVSMTTWLWHGVRRS